MQPESVNMFFREVKDELRIRKLKQGAFAEKIGLSPTSMSCYMKRKKTPSLKTLEDIAEGLGMNVIVCLGDKDD